MKPAGLRNPILHTTLALLLAACTPSLRGAAKDIAQGAVPTAVDASLRTLEEQRTRERVLELMSSPEFQKTFEALGKDFTRGALNGLDDEAMAKRSSALASSIAATATRMAVDAALSEVASPANEERMAQILSVATAAATHAAVQAMADELPRTLGPAIGEMMRQNITPTLNGFATDPGTRSIVGALAYEASRQAVLGSNDAMAELEKKQHKAGLLAHLSGIFSAGGAMFAILVAFTTALIVGLLAALIHTRSKLKHAALAEHVEEDVEGRRPGTARPRHHSPHARPSTP